MTRRWRTPLGAIGASIRRIFFVPQCLEIKPPARRFGVIGFYQSIRIGHLHFRMAAGAGQGFGGMAIGASQCLVARNHLVCDYIIHIRLSETDLAGEWKSDRLHSLPGGLDPIEVLPESLPQLGRHEGLVFGVRRYDSRILLERVYLRAGFVYRSARLVQHRRFTRIDLVAHQMPFVLAIIPGIGRSEIHAPLECAFFLAEGGRAVFILLDLHIFTGLGPVPENPCGGLLGEFGDMACLA